MIPIEKLIVHGTRTEIKVDKSWLKEGAEYHLSGGNRDTANKQIIDLSKEKDRQLLEFELEDGTTWMCDATTLHEVYPELDPALKPKSERSSNGSPETFTLPTTVSAPPTERGIVGKIAVKILRVFVKKAIDHGIKKIATKLEDKHLLNGITKDSTLWKAMHTKEGGISKGAALFSVNENFKFDVLPKKVTRNKPYFLFIHGTNSDTLGAFIDLKSSAMWQTLQDTYQENIIAFQHRTLTESPLQNTVKLAKMLPNGAELHLLTHSRGGLIGDILNKYCESNDGFTKIHLDLLEKEGRTNDVAAIRELNKIFNKKNLKITKFIRVACPAAGTKLASKRLDHILNVFFNLIGGVFGDVLKELLSAAIQTKDNVDVLDGLEAMNPESTFIKILNDPFEKNQIDGCPLIIISGNGRVNLSGQGLLVILGKLFYWQRNDLVVNTDSMYLGARRRNTVQYFFDQGVAVNHVKYFANTKTQEAINLALKTAACEPIPGFKQVEQHEVPASDRGLVEHGELYPEPDAISGNRPIVILLPGIMGSNLELYKKEIWLHYGRIMGGGLMKLNYLNGSPITADSIVKTSYYKLYKWLLGKYDVEVYPFDWRKPLKDSAENLNSKIESLLTHKQPIKIIGHSMGGVLVRDFITYHSDTWQELNTSKGFQLLFLGSPLSGSHRILTVLFGQDGIIRKLAMLDFLHSKKTLLGVFSKFPGILDLLPIIDPEEDSDSDFANPKIWEKMRDAFGKKNWPLPSKNDLTRFAAYRNHILSERKENPIDYTNMTYIAGKDKMTPTGYYVDDIGPKKQLYFLYTGAGDQSVTWELGIPKEMDKKSVYYSRTTHGALANDPGLFSAIDEILSQGSTKLLRNSKPMVRSDEKIFRGDPDIDFDLSEDGLAKTIFGLHQETKAIGNQIPIVISVSSGDLRYASHPILAGHFLNDSILYAEDAVDRYLGGSLSNKHDLGLYPGAVGTNAIFTKTGDSDFEGAIIVGMGEQDQLTPFQLAKSVEQGVLNYLLSLRGTKTPKNGLGISSLVMASGYGGLSIESSIRATITGVHQANEKIVQISTTEYSTIRRIEFVELYANRALNCLYAINQIEKNDTEAIQITLGSKKIKKLLGIRKRIPMDVTADWWNRVTVKHSKVDNETGELESMVFGASTNDSREEENEIYSSTPLVNQFISEVSTNNQWNDCTAKTLFELLIPNGLKEKLKRKGNILWILDAKTASYPWELLQDSTLNAKPISVNSGMIRQLSTTNYRHTIKRTASPRALVVADPILEDYIGQLPGARDEGILVNEMLEGNGFPADNLIGSNASAIIKQLFCTDYSIIHLAGHGVYKPKSPKESGMVIGKKLFLTVFQIEQMPVVPELVFVNCCHLGYTNDSDEEQFHQNRYKLAANIGTQLIEIGVKAVIAAGWAVNDDAAKEFAKVFYEHMLDSYPFGEAVKKARSSVYEKYPETNTWGAYQCYGDPFFKLKNLSNNNWIPKYVVAQEAEIDLENLLNKLQMGATNKKDALDDLEAIMEAVAAHENFKTATILEREAQIYQELGMYTDAVDKFQELLDVENAQFSFKSLETFCNSRIKNYVRSVSEVYATTLDDAIKKEKYGAANADICKVIKELQVLLDAGRTAERLNLMGSAYKRLAMLSEQEAVLDKYQDAVAYYKEAFEHPNNGNKLYSLTNTVEVAFLMNYMGARKQPIITKITEEDKTISYNLRSEKSTKTQVSVIKLLEKQRKKLTKGVDSTDMDYWAMVATLNIDLCFLLIDKKRNSDKTWKALENNFNLLWKKAGSEAKKVAELEHLQFLIHALHGAAGNPHHFSPIGSTTSKDRLRTYIEELRAVLNTVWGKNRILL